MKLVTVEHEGTIRHGRLEQDRVLVTGDGDLLATVSGREPTDAVVRELPLSDVRLCAPLLAPGKVIAAAANYQEHVREGGNRERDEKTASPRLFLKPDTSIIGPGEPIELNPITEQLDWEVELAVVIGRGGQNISVNEALDHVFGYATSNDISARSLSLGQRDGEAWTGFFDWLEGKWLDGSAPLGPYLVTADEVPDPQALGLTLSVNGIVRQNSSTAGMIHTVADLISFSSRLMTLRPGDVILTGTPAGVGGATGDFLSIGDVMVAEVEGLGTLTTPVIAPPPSRTASTARTRGVLPPDAPQRSKERV